MDISAIFHPSEGIELLLLAEKIGRIGIIDWDVRAGAVRLSPNALTMYGLGEKFDGRYDSWIATVYREDVIRLRNVIAEAFEARAREFELDFRIIRPSDNEMRWLLARRLAFYDEAGNPYRVVGVSVDVTDRKLELVELRNFTEALEAAVRERTRELEARTRELEAENEALRKAEELLRQAQKMEAVGQLTGGVAHDFNNLLTIMQSGLEMIGRHVTSLDASLAASRIVRGRDMALEAVRRATRLTERLLAFARQQPLEPKAFNANRLVGAVCELLQRTVGETIALETVLAAGLSVTQADINQLENALLNLALNARDAMPNGGKVTIETANAHLDGAYVRMLAEPVKAGQYVMISVSDTGAGMDVSTRQRAFEPFFTTKGVGKGTGLGLSQVYGFVRQSSGHLAIYSEVGEGTTVKIYLPRHHGEEDLAEDVFNKAASDSRSPGAETILVVEDDETLRLYTVEILTDLGYSVLAAANAAAALEIIGRGRDIDLLFTDIIMPGGMNGRELANQAIRQRPALRVLFTTGYTANAIIYHGRLDPDVELISKPFTYDSLAHKIRTLLDAKRS